MHFKLLNPGKYLSATDLGGVEPTYKILRVVLEEIEEDAPKGAPPSKKKKGLVWLEGVAKGWLLCVTTAKALATMFGDETEKWAGHCVTLFADMVQSFGEMVPAVRVRGSPELTQMLSYSVKRRKKSETFSLIKTSQAKTGPDTTANYKEAMAAINLRLTGPDAGAFLKKITGKSKRDDVDANDVALVKTARAGEFPAEAQEADAPL